MKRVADAYRLCLCRSGKVFLHPDGPLLYFKIEPFQRALNGVKDHAGQAVRQALLTTNSGRFVLCLPGKKGRFYDG